MHLDKQWILDTLGTESIWTIDLVMMMEEWNQLWNKDWDSNDSASDSSHTYGDKDAMDDKDDHEDHEDNGNHNTTMDNSLPHPLPPCHHQYQYQYHHPHNQHSTPLPP